MPLRTFHQARQVVRGAAAGLLRTLRNRPGLTVFAACAALLETRVLYPSPVGLADNTDEARILCRLRLAPIYPPGVHHSVGFYLTLHYRVNPSVVCTDKYRTTEYPIVWLAAKITGLVDPSPGLDVRILGALHIGMAAACIALITTAARTTTTRLIAAGGLMVLAADPLVADYFQAAYSENAEFIGVLAACAGFLWWRRGGRAALPGIALFAAGSVIALGAKTQILPSVPLFVGLAAAGCRAAWPAKVSGRVLAAGALAGVLAFLAVMPPSADGHLKFANKMNLVFVALLPAGHDPKADLRELGLPAHLASLENLNYWCMDLPPGYSRELSRRLDFPDVGEFLARNPLVAGRIAWSAAADELAARPTYSVCPGQRSLGTHTAADGVHPDRADTRLQLVTDLARHARPFAPPALLLGWLLPVFAALAARRRRRPLGSFTVLGLFGAGLAATQFFTAAFGDGIDTIKHTVLSLFAMVLGLLFATAGRFEHSAGAGPGRIRRSEPGLIKLLGQGARFQFREQSGWAPTREQLLSADDCEQSQVDQQQAVAEQEIDGVPA